MSNVSYIFENSMCYGILDDGYRFIIDKEDFEKIRNIKWYLSNQGNSYYLIDNKGKKLHAYLLKVPKKFEVDHINMNTFDNRKSNLRICTHQQNQMNQDLQKNNTSGVVGVSYYAPRKKYRARIKVCRKDIHLGYYDSFVEAVKARNIGMLCMFGQYGRYNDVGNVDEWIKQKVVEKCTRFAHLANNSAFFDFYEGVVDE